MLSIQVYKSLSEGSAVLRSTVNDILAESAAFTIGGFPPDPGVAHPMAGGVDGDADMNAVCRNHDGAPVSRTAARENRRSAPNQQTGGHGLRNPIAPFGRAAVAGRPVPACDLSRFLQIRAEPTHEKNCSVSATGSGAWRCAGRDADGPVAGRHGGAVLAPAGMRASLDLPARLWAVCPLDVRGLPRQSLGHAWDTVGAGRWQRGGTNGDADGCPGR